MGGRISGFIIPAAAFLRNILYRMASLSTAVPGNAEKKNVVLGKVNGAETRILVDGADFGLVPRVLVPDDAMNCGEKYIAGVHGHMVLHKCTKATFEVAGLEFEREVVIDDSGCESSECILPLDLGVEEEVMAFVKTRSQARVEAELDIVDDNVVVKELESVVGNSGQAQHLFDIRQWLSNFQLQL